MAWICLGYNYYFLSRYDSAQKYFSLLLNQNVNHDIGYYLAISGEGLILERQGKYDKSYDKFIQVDKYFKKQENDKQFNSLFWTANAINLIGLATLEYYYTNSAEKMESRLLKIADLDGSKEGVLANQLKANLFYLLAESHLRYSSSNLKNDTVFEFYIKNYLSCLDSTMLYQLGNLFELLGINCRNLQGISFEKLMTKTRDDTRFINNITKKVDHFISDSNVNNKELSFLHESKKYFVRHGDPYQIAAINYYIANSYLTLLKDSTRFLTQRDRHVLDSAIKYINIAINTYYLFGVEQSRPVIIPKSFDSHDFNIASYKLVSLRWFVKFLRKYIEIYGLVDDKSDFQLQNYFYYIDFENELQRNESESILAFFKKMEVAQEKKIKAEEEKYSLLGITSLIFLVIIAGLGIYVYFKKRRLQINYNNNVSDIERINDWNLIENDLLKHRDNVLSHDRPILKNEIESLVQKLGEHFDCEFCGISLVHENKIVEIIANSKGRTKRSTQRIIDRMCSIPLGMTFISELLSKKQDYIFYNEEGIENLNDSFASFIKERVVSTNGLSKIISLGLFNDTTEHKEPIGFLLILNPLKYKEELEQSFLQNFSKHLTNLFIAILYRRSLLNQIHDDEFFNSIRECGNNIDSILDKATRYLSLEYDCGIISFRIPVINGEDENNDKHLLFPLRYLYINDKIPQKSKVRNYYREQKKVLKLSELSYSEQFATDFPHDGYLDENNQKNSFYKDLNLDEILDTRFNLVIPLRKIIPQKNVSWPSSTMTKNLYGIINIRFLKSSYSDSFHNISEILSRLTYISQHLTQIINSVMSEKKLNQLHKLKDEIEILYKTKTSFFNQICYLISNVMNAEICSLFLYDKRYNRITLKGTNAKRAIFNKKEISLDKIDDFDEEIFYMLTETDSLTVRSLLECKTIQVFSTKYYDHFSKKFMEYANTNIEDYSIMFVPLINKENKSVGVLKFLGKIKAPDNLLHSFWDFDRQTIELVATLLERFIENAELDKEKDGFIMQVVHEMLSPLSEILHKSGEYKSRMVRNSKMTSEFIKYHSDITSNILLFKQILIDLDDVSSKQVLSCNMNLEDVNQIILDVVNLFEESAHFDKGLTIQTNISNLPKLMVDQNRIKQVFINLLRNAIRYSNSNSVIKIFYKDINEQFEGKKTNRWHEIKFVDDGIGILEGEKEDIFRLYYRGHNAREHIISGAGIGLYLVKKIMLLHGGDCIVRNLQNPTEISVIFPKYN